MVKDIQINNLLKIAEQRKNNWDHDRRGRMCGRYNMYRARHCNYEQKIRGDRRGER